MIKDYLIVKTNLMQMQNLLENKLGKLIYIRNYKVVITYIDTESNSYKKTPTKKSFYQNPNHKFAENPLTIHCLIINKSLIDCLSYICL